MRLDHLLTLYFFGLFARRRALPPGAVRIPILMYHSISDEAEEGHPYYWINTSPALFAQHMQYLTDHNYEVIPLSRAVDTIRGSSLNTQYPTLNTVVLTFDDGYADFYTHAFPVLQRHGFTATVFLPTDYIGNATPGLRGKAHLTWDQVRELSAAGITFGSHTCSHPQLHDLSHEQIQHQLSASKQIIESQLGQVSASENLQPATHDSSRLSVSTIHYPLCTEVDGFCYPYKFPEQDTRFIASLADTLKSAGYDCCLSTRIGTVNAADDIYALKRLPINSADDLALFDAKLTGAYDWMATLQAFSKKARSAEKAKNE